MSDTDFSTFPIVVKGNRFADFEVGQVLRHHWGRTITEADNVVYSTSMCTWNPLYLNIEYARSVGHPTIVVNPMLVLCMTVGLSVEDLSEMGGRFWESTSAHSGQPCTRATPLVRLRSCWKRGTQLVDRVLEL